MDHVNAQMEKLDHITDSAVDAADSADTAVRAVSLAITRPCRRSPDSRPGSLTASPTSRRNGTGGAQSDAAKAAAAAREQELEEELREADKP